MALADSILIILFTVVFIIIYNVISVLIFKNRYYELTLFLNKHKFTNEENKKIAKIQSINNIFQIFKLK